MQDCFFMSLAPYPSVTVQSNHFLPFDTPHWLVRDMFSKTIEIRGLKLSEPGERPPQVASVVRVFGLLLSCHEQIYYALLRYIALSIDLESATIFEKYDNIRERLDCTPAVLVSDSFFPCHFFAPHFLKFYICMAINHSKATYVKPQKIIKQRLRAHDD